MLLSGSVYTYGPVIADASSGHHNLPAGKKSTRHVDCILQRVGSLSSSDLDLDVKSDITSGTNFLDSSVGSSNYVSFDISNGPESEDGFYGSARGTTDLLLERAEEQDTFVEYSSTNNSSQENNLERMQGVAGDSRSASRKNILEAVRSEVNFANLFSQSTLPNNKLLDDVSGLKKYAVRRHHSAPQSDVNWLQVGA
jgi:hypothetical protein